jgi:uncharacterized protein YndB with AHSA1/START domain
MNYETSIEIDAPRERVWAVLADVERWPEWTASMRGVTYVGGDRLAVGSRVRIQQPRLPAMVWEVTAVEPGQSFAWQTTSNGVTTVATHRLSPGPRGGITVSLGVRQSGALAWLVGLLAGGMTRRYVRMEAEGLQRQCQAAAAPLSP